MKLVEAMNNNETILKFTINSSLYLLTVEKEFMEENQKIEKLFEKDFFVFPSGSVEYIEFTEPMKTNTQMRVKISADEFRDIKYYRKTVFTEIGKISKDDKIYNRLKEHLISISTNIVIAK